jgi:hypothetical protein
MFADCILSGSFTSPASGNANQVLKLPFQPDLFEIWIQGNSSGDNWISSANPGPVKHAVWQSGMAAASALCTANTNGAATDTSSFLSAGGISVIAASANQYGSRQTGSGVTAANPGVVTINSHGYATGDVVLIEGTTAMLQLSGIPWEVTSTGANTFNIGNAFSTAGFAAAATAVAAQKLLYPGVFTPQLSYVVKVTTGSTTTIECSYPHGYAVNQTVRFKVPSQWGMTQLDGLKGVISSVTTYGFVVNINSSAFTAFAFPTSAVAAAGVSPATCEVIAEDASIFSGSAVDNGYYAVQIGNSATAGAAVLSANSALCLWRAQKSAKVYTSLTS